MNERLSVDTANV